MSLVERISLRREKKCFNVRKFRFLCGSYVRRQTRLVKVIKIAHIRKGLTQKQHTL